MPAEEHQGDEPWWVDWSNACVWQGDTMVHLPPKTLAVLRLLTTQAGQLVTKEALLEAIWPEAVVSEAVLTVCIGELRKALRETAQAPRFIQTVHRRGYRFIGYLPTVTAPAPPVSSPALPLASAAPPLLVGRDGVIAQLHQWLAHVRQGARQIVWLTGEPGMGKTAVVNAFVAQAAATGDLWLAQGQCIEHYGAGEAYLPVLEALGRLCREPAGAALLPVLEQHAPTWLVQMPALCSPAVLDAVQRRSLGATQERMLRELAEAVEVCTAMRPVLLILEDLHWSDYATLDLLTYLARRAGPTRLLVLGTYRPIEVLLRGHPLQTVKQELILHGEGVELPLELLTAAAVAQYLALRCAGGADLPPAIGGLAQSLYQRTDGHPLFLVQVVEHLLQRGVLGDGAGPWQGQPEAIAAAIEIPTSVRQMIEQQFDRLSSEEQRVLEAASVAGSACTAAAVAAGLDLAMEAVEDRCAGLAQRGQFLLASGIEAWPDGTVTERYGWRHALYQEVVYERVPEGRRLRLHRRIGIRVDTGYGEQAREHAAELAMHFVQGREYARAVESLRQAGDRALMRSACREAMAYFEQALSALSQLPETRETREQAIDLWLALRTALQPLGDLERVLTCLRTAEALAVTLDDPRRLARISLLLSRYYSLMGLYNQASTAAQRALTFTTASGDTVLQALANLNLGLAYHAQGDYRRAGACLRQTVMALDGARGREHFGQTILPAVNACAHLAWCHAEVGTFAEGCALGNAGLQIAEAVGHPGSLMVALWGVGLIALHQGDLRRALPQLERAMRLCEEADLPMWFPAIAAELGAAYTLGGRVADAVPLLTRALEQAREAPGSQANGSVSLGEAHLLTGRLEDAHTLTEYTLAFTREHQERGRQASALRLLGEIAAHRDPPEVELAVTHYRQALALAEVLGMRPLQAHCHRGLGILYAQTGQAEQACVALSAAITLYRAMDMTFWLPETEAARAQAEGR
jgi:DNA-binding winged helix-turn-helix (wHTH) protein/tetratricopeptide (TPR) repeat protein